MWLIQALCVHFDVTLVTTSQFELDFYNRFAGTQLERDQFHVRRLWLLPTPRKFPMTAVQGPLFQRAARSCAAEFDICLSAMNLVDLGTLAVQFLADIDWLPSSDSPYQSDASPTKPGKESQLRRLYHTMSARIQNLSGRDLLREDVLVSNSEWVASILRTKGIQSSVIYPPVPWLPYPRDWETRRKDFVWFGRIAPQKKVEQAIRIIAGLRKAGFDCALHIAGTAIDEGYFKSIRDLAERMGDWVVLRGPFYGKGKGEFLTQFRYALHTRADEPFGITLVELMKAGCIPFAPASCGSAEILKDPSVLYESQDQAVAKIGAVLSDPELCQSVRASVKQRADYFSTDAFCELAVSLVSNVLQRASSNSDVHIPQS
jgi:glycosyltransferase involved in cell wall biosynthesis